MDLKDYEISGDRLYAEYREGEGSLEEKYARYRRELESISANNNCAELMKIKAAYRIEHGDDLTPPPPEVASAIKKAKQVTMQETFALLKTSKMGRSILKALERRRIVIFIASVGTSASKDHGKLQRLGDWHEETERLRNGCIIIDHAYVGNYIGTAGVIAHEIRHILDCEEASWAEKRDEDGNIIRKPRKVGIAPRSISGMEKEIPQFRANIYSGGLLKELKWQTGRIWTTMSADQKNALRAIWGPDWDGSISTSGVCTEMDAKLELYYEKFHKVRDRIKLKRCGRICRNKRYGLCDNLVKYPPCWHHV